MRSTLIALVAATGCAFAASLAAAVADLPAPARVAVVLAGWSVLALLVAYLFLPPIDLPWRQLRRVPGRRRVALTVDDGPHPDSTPALPDALRVARVRATFFLVGAAVEQWPELARRIVVDGHAVGNHTFRHRLLTFRSGAQVEDEIVACQRALARLGLDGVRWFRPPHGFKPIGLHRLLRRHRLTFVGWQGAIRDTDAPGPAAIVARALRLARDGRILLLHDNPSCRGDTARAVPELVAAYRARGFEFVLLDQ